MRKLFASAAAVALVITGCSSSKPAGTGTGGPTALSGSILVDAASSLLGSFNTLKASFEELHPGTTIKFNFGSSGDLSAGIVQGQPADVFASAAPKNMQTVISAGYAAGSTNFVKNTAEIAVVAGNPKNIASLADLGKSGIRVALCVVTAPCGALAQSILANANVTVKPTASEPDVKSTLAIVQTGEVDAGIVYVTDVKAAGSKVTGVPIPAAQNGTTEYPIAALTHSKNAALAQAFVDYVKSPAGQSVLTAAGFQSP